MPVHLPVLDGASQQAPKSAPVADWPLFTVLISSPLTFTSIEGFSVGDDLKTGVVVLEILVASAAAANAAFFTTIVITTLPHSAVVLIMSSLFKTPVVTRL